MGGGVPRSRAPTPLNAQPASLNFSPSSSPSCGNSSGGFVSGPPGGNAEDEECEDDGSGDANGGKDAGNGPGNSGPAPGLPPAGSGGAAGFNRFKPRTGNLHRVIKDLRLFAGVGQHRLEFRRTYNSRAISAEQYFGDGWSWTHSYQWSISNVGAEGNDIFRVIYPAGTRNDFADIGDNLTFRTTTAFSDYISRDGTNYTLNLRNGFRYRFSRSEGAEGYVYIMQGFWDAHGNWYGFTNDANGRFVRVTEPTGRWLETTYNTNGHIAQVEASDGRTVTYSYQKLDPEDSNSPIVLTGADYGDGTTASYEYTPGQWPMLVHAVDPKYPGKGSNIRYTCWTGWGYLKEERDGVTDELLVTNNGSEVIYANGATNTYVFDLGEFGGTGLPLTKTDALGGVKTYTYDTSGFPDSVTDELGRVTYRTNNAMGNVIARTYPDSSTESWTRDALEQVLTYTDRLGHTTT